MKWKRLILAAVLTVPMVTLAEKPSTEPTRPMLGRGDIVFGRLNRRENGPASRPSQEDIDEAVGYMKSNFPNRFELFNRLPERGPFRNNVVLPKLVQRYHQLMRMQDQNPDVYEMVLAQAKLEDDSLGWAKAKSEGKPDAEVRLHESVRRMIEHGLKERRDRIEKLEKTLDEQKQKLAEDQKNEENLITQKIADAETEFKHLSRGGERDAMPDANPQKPEINALQK